MCFEYDDHSDCQDVRQVKCRKPHQCAGCDRAIGRGEKAECVTGLFDGAWYKYYACDACQRMTMAIALRELRHGCSWHTAWIAINELRWYLEETAKYDEPIRPLGMPTIADCRRAVDDAWERSGGRWWNGDRMILLEGF